MSTHRLAILGLLLLIAGCGENSVAVDPHPREPNSHAIGHYCRMTLTEHVGPKGQILLEGWSEPLWFTSVHDAFTYIAQDLGNEAEMAGFWVNDMGQGSWEKPAPGSWIEAKSAFYVVESKKSASMGEARPCPSKSACGRKHSQRSSAAASSITSKRSSLYRKRPPAFPTMEARND